MALELQLIQHHSGILIPATPETRISCNQKPGSAIFLLPSSGGYETRISPALFALLNLGFEYWEPTWRGYLE